MISAAHIFFTAETPRRKGNEHDEGLCSAPLRLCGEQRASAGNMSGTNIMILPASSRAQGQDDLAGEVDSHIFETLQSLSRQQRF